MWLAAAATCCAPSLVASATTLASCLTAAPSARLWVAGASAARSAAAGDNSKHNTAAPTSIMFIIAFRSIEHIAVFFPQRRLLHLAGAADWQRLQEYDFLRHPPARQALGEKCEDVLRLQIMSRLAHHEQQGPLLPFRMLHAD